MKQLRKYGLPRGLATFLECCTNRNGVVPHSANQSTTTKKSLIMAPHLQHENNIRNICCGWMYKAALSEHDIIFFK